MKKMLALIKFDVQNALRDSLIIYILIAPLLLSAGLRFFIPQVESSTLRFVIPGEGWTDPAASFGRKELIDGLSLYGSVEQADSIHSMERRVLQRDDAIAILPSEGNGQDFHVMLEGNEGAEAEALMGAILQRISNDEDKASYDIELRSQRSPIMEYAALGLVMLAALIGGLAVSFSMVEEKEQKLTSAFAVTPISTTAYFGARGILSWTIGVIIALAGHLLLGQDVQAWSKLLIMLIASLPLPMIITLLVGGLSNNQIQAVASLKIVMMVYFTLPFSSILVPRNWHWLYYPFANYWMFRGFEGVYVTGAREGDLGLAALMTLVSGMASLLLLAIFLGTRLKPRKGKQ